MVIRCDHDGLAPVSIPVGADQQIMQQETRDQSSECKHHQGHRHHPGALVDMLLNVWVRAGRAVERHEDDTPGVERSAEGGRNAHNPTIERRSAAGRESRLEDGVLGIVAGEGENTCQGETAEPERHVGDRDFPPQPAHPPHVLFVRHGMDHRAGAQKQERFEEGVGQQMEDRCGIGTHTRREEHVSELRHCRVGDHLLDVILHTANGGGKKAGGATDDSNQC